MTVGQIRCSQRMFCGLSWSVQQRKCTQNCTHVFAISYETVLFQRKTLLFWKKILPYNTRQYCASEVMENIPVKRVKVTDSMLKWNTPQQYKILFTCSTIIMMLFINYSLLEGFHYDPSLNLTVKCIQSTRCMLWGRLSWLQKWVRTYDKTYFPQYHMKLNPFQNLTSVFHTKNGASIFWKVDVVIY